jgi:hypothetical protein
MIVLPKVISDNSHRLRNENIILARHSEVCPRQQAHDNFQQQNQDSRTSASFEPHSTLPLLPEQILGHSILEPGAPDKMYRVSTPIFLLHLLLIH